MGRRGTRASGSRGLGGFARIRKLKEKGRHLPMDRVFFTLLIVLIRVNPPNPRSSASQSAGARLGLSVLIALALSAASSGAAPPAPRFEADVLPILQSNCTRCHGATARKGGLDLSSATGIFRGGSSGAVLTPHKPAESLLYTVLHEGRMPPRKETRRPTTEQIALIRRWIEAGAPAGTLEGARANGEREHPYHVALSSLRLRCMVCHGPRRQEGGLSLASKADMLKGGKSGPALRPGNSGESPLIRKVKA